MVVVCREGQKRVPGSLLLNDLAVPGDVGQRLKVYCRTEQSGGCALENHWITAWKAADSTRLELFSRKHPNNDRFRMGKIASTNSKPVPEMPDIRFPVVRPVSRPVTCYGAPARARHAVFTSVVTYMDTGTRTEYKTHHSWGLLLSND